MVSVLRGGRKGRESAPIMAGAREKSMKAKRGRPKRDGGQGELISLRLQSELLDQLDSYAAEMARREPGPPWSRSDAIRRLLYLGLAKHKVK